jgi:hypothetical protein
MKRIIFILIALSTMCNTNTFAQYKIKDAVLNSNKKLKSGRSRATFNYDPALDGCKIYYTPESIVTEISGLGFKQSVFKLSFQKINDELYIYASYMTCKDFLVESSIRKLFFIFTNGDSLKIDVSSILSANMFNAFYTDYSTRSRVSRALLHTFAENEPMVVGYICDSHSFSTTIGRNHSLYVGESVLSLLDNIKVKGKEMREIYNKGFFKSSKDKWDY